MTILVDAPNFVWRSHWAAPNLSSRGRPTGVLHIGLTMLAGMPVLFQPQQVIFLWDGDSSTTWRKKIDKEYKANRVQNTKERKAVYPQIEVFKTILSAIGILQLCVSDLEADDLAGILTTALKKKSQLVMLVSSDKDFLQLLGPGVVQIRGWKGKTVDRWDQKRLLEKYGLTPDDWPKFLALVGDTSDNIPKVLRRGQGDKAACKILQNKRPVELSLTQSEQDRYKLNLQLTTIKTEMKSSGIKPGCYIKPRPHDSASWDYLTSTLADYELNSVFGVRRALWTVGGWR